MEKFPPNGFPEDFYGEETPDRSFKDYIRLVKSNLLLFIIVALVVLAGAIGYAIFSTNIYTTEATIKLNRPQGNILQSPLIPEIENLGSDRFVSNEIEILKSYKLRLRVAEALIDTFRVKKNKSLFSIIFKKDLEGKMSLLPARNITKVLDKDVDIEQKRGLDIISIQSESPSAYESALIGNIYANKYKNLNLETNRDQLTFLKNFLDKQKNEKQGELRAAEDTLKAFQEKGGVIALDEQSNVLIEQLSNFESQQNAAKIELMASNEVLAQYKDELEKAGP